MVAAEVIGQDPSSWFKSVTINKGEGDGVKRGMAVISPDGVVGQILKAAPHYATVLLVTDYNSAIDSIVQKTRARAIVEGSGENRCQLKYLLRTDEVNVGDVIVTSGLGGNFPKGLLIGEIRRVEKKGRGVFQYADLMPSVDLTKLEEVLVITESPVPANEEKVRKPKKSPAGDEEKMKRILLLHPLWNPFPHGSDDLPQIDPHPEDPAGLHADLHPFSGVFGLPGSRRDPGLPHGLSGRSLFREHLRPLYLLQAPPLLWRLSL